MGPMKSWNWQFIFPAPVSVFSPNIRTHELQITAISKHFLFKYENTHTNMLSGINSFAMAKLKCILFLQVWIGWLISILVCIGCIRLFIVLTNKYYNYQNVISIGFNTLSEVSMYIFGTLTDQGENFVFTVYIYLVIFLI